jgi:hypothetical protein
MFKENTTTDEEKIREPIRMELGTLSFRSMGHQKSRPEKTRDLRNLMLEEDVKIKWSDKRRNEKIYRGEVE